jgi:hypothetical protein
MSIKHFCDGCGEEVQRNFVQDRLVKDKQIGNAKFSIEVMVATDGVWNGGCICLPCLQRLFNGAVGAPASKWDRKPETV